jgi:ABC-2 type transport system permease protein
MNTLLRVARKEFGAFFSSPIAFIFLGTFLAASLFVFFWAETFFARNITEVRPLFEWMPVLLIFLVAAVTMRMWAEEHRAGTLEFLLTAPVPPAVLVFGKFFACLGLIALALLLTLPLLITVSLLGPLDWGPVLGGYIATLFLAAAYIAVGLFVSVKAENQIVSLIASCLICGLLYLIGSETLAAFFGNQGAELLHLLGSGSRFKSITRGVIDVRDLYYYLSLTGVFLCLNIYGLEKIRWAGNPASSHHRHWRIACGLVIANFLAANLWLAQLGTLRSDMTQGRIYSISEATRSYLGQLHEPLLIRGYFSAQTHPLLAPLVPRLRDLLEEYAVAGGGKVRVEFVDPAEHPDLEQEAGQKYGIRPVPFQTASKYQAAVTNSYFDILIRYGDQFEVLGFRDLIEIKAQNEQSLDVELRNPEYDLTRAIKKVLYSYQGGGDLFSSISKPVVLTGYFSPDDKLPKELVKLKADLLALAKELETQSGGRFSSTVVDPDAEGGKAAKQIGEEYGFRPMTASLFDRNAFWLYATLASGGRVVEIPLLEDLDADKEGLRRLVSAGLKRFSSGFAKTIALSVPQATPPMPQFGMPGQGLQFNALRDVLSQEHTVIDANLAKGQVPAGADLLLLAAPDNLDEKQVFAVDQFLMQGGTVIIAASPYSISLDNDLSVTPHTTGLEGWLAHHGISMEKNLVLDPQNMPFPVPMERNLGGFTVQETQLVKYPYFVDVRPDGMNADSGITSGLNQITMNWASPVTVDAAKSKGRKLTRLLESSAKSWLSASTQVQPDFRLHRELGFPIEGKQERRLLAAAVEGGFSSYFAGKPSPLLKKEEKKAEEPPKPETDEAGKEKEKEQVIARQLDKSPDTARIILFASGSFVSDPILGISSSVMRSGYLEPVQLVANAVDWSLEDRGLLAIRGRSHFSRPLDPMSKKEQLFWEYLNYGLALLGLAAVWLLRARMRRRTAQAELELLQPILGRA